MDTKLDNAEFVSQRPAEVCQRLSVVPPKSWIFSTVHDPKTLAFLAQSTPHPVWFSASLIEYQESYLRGSGSRILDFSGVFMRGQEIIAFVPLTISWVEFEWRLGSQEDAVRAPLLATAASAAERERIEDELIDFVSSLAAALNVKSIRWLELGSHQTISGFHRGLLQRGALAWTEVGLYCDLTLSDAALWSSIRRRYRSQINQAKRLWCASVIACPTQEQFDAFRALHLAVAGRATRSSESWAKQHQAAIAGDAFLVLLHDSQNVLVGGALIATTRTDGLYAVGAYDRSLFDQPVSHLAQWAAIEHLRSTGRTRYFIGLRFFAHTHLKPSAKEVSIAHFKEGFANLFLAHHYFETSHHNALPEQSDTVETTGVPSEGLGP